MANHSGQSHLVVASLLTVSRQESYTKTHLRHKVSGCLHRHPREGGEPLLVVDSRLRGNDEKAMHQKPMHHKPMVSNEFWFIKATILLMA